MLDQPIPFSNLGTVIPDIFQGPHHHYLPKYLNHLQSDKHKEILSKLFQQINAAYVSYLNAKQLFSFIDEYQTKSKDLPLSKVHATRVNFDFIEDRFENNIRQILSIDFSNFSKISEKFTEIEEWTQEFQNIHELLQEVLIEIKNICRGVWAKFEVLSMTMGISLMAFVGCFVLAAPLFFSQALLVEPCRYFGVQIFIGFLFCGVAFTFSVFGTEETEQDSAIVFLAVSFSFSLWLLCCNVMPSYAALKFKIQLVPEFFAKNKIFVLFIVCYFAHAGSYFANSFIIHEDTVVLFMLQSFIIIRCVHFLVNVVNSCKSKGVRSFSIITSQVIRSISFNENRTNLGLFSMALVCLRTTKYFWFCREMQLKCNFSSFVLPLASLLSDFTQGHVSERLFIALASIVCLLIVTSYYLRKNGNLNGNTPAALSVKYTSVIIGIFIISHWFLQIMITHPISKLFDVQNVQQIILPRLVYLLSLLAIFSIVFKPLAVHLHWDKKGRTGEKKVFVYGLKTVYSSSIISFLFMLFLLMCMVMMDGMSLPMFCLWLVAFVVTKLFAMDYHSITMSK